MRDLVVKRTVAAMSALFLVSAGAFAWLVRGGPEVVRPAAQTADSRHEGEALFTQHCSACHGLGDISHSMQADRRPRAAFEAFLRDHGDASDTEDGVLVDYLLSRPVK